MSAIDGLIGLGSALKGLNFALFASLNAPAHPAPAILYLAMFCAEGLIWAIPAGIGLAWLRGGESARKAALAAAMAGLAGLLLNQLIGLAWPHPRPFMIGLGHTLIPHAADSSFPSDHLTLWWSAAFSLLLRLDCRRVGYALAALGLAMAWARIYLGVHFPFDMAGAAATALAAAWLAGPQHQPHLEPIYRLALRARRLLFGRLIVAGWLRA
ncbi:undecaprenyl-diphosphatase [Chromobacterium sp. ATCC 53434]|uniref:undecaprenyl-diphosphatase n=1 Tax=Chromobacterium TaxID=535 RepID=UPI000C775740|nr:undecaprenyl-diphosphatase [Chromobacterium sp. ATCC 53434]AUH49988.1 undecaprenyl-diphosphatase [Chromobacterium sp. ATCC 53434]